MGFLSKVERDGFASKMGEGNHNFGVITDESLIKIHKPKKKLNILNSLGFRPILNNLNLGLVHG